ncbi:putative capsule polysaccharide biosynthesis [Dichotomopilus funicola]|uniref:Capsule polysaccharide biosynthesis n=1 Tax=Dichotomopilus funicola TaxID=1934379 RepID=A0AAN6ZJD1_9PEZI|nr:putative capsule polysaccharide biosynthesis [Dichotomopilus funicola]
MDNLPASIPNTAALLGSALAVCFLLANAKSLPLAHSFRLLPSFYGLLLKPRLFPVAKKTGVLPSEPSTAAAARPALFKHHVTSSRAVLLDLDINMHKSNSTFFADADINRAELLTRLLGPGLAATGPPAAIPLLAAVQCNFKREISPFQAYHLSSRILAWDDKSLFTVTYFLKPGAKLPADVEVAGGPGAVLGDPSLKRSVYAVMVTRYVCKAGRVTVEPAAVLEAAGLLVAGATAQGAEKEKHEAGLVAAGDVEIAVKHGIQYVGDCMV